MSRDLRIILAIMAAALVLAAPLIFAAPSAVNTGNYNYLAVVFHVVPTPTDTPVPTATTAATPTKTAIPTKTPVPPAATRMPVPPTATPTLPPPSYSNCQADPNPNAAPHYPVRITNINKVAETVTLQNTSTSAVDLTGWHMCSITGNQQHPISGTLAPGASQTFPGPAGSIWNNSTEDDGALYNPAGQLVSYFNS